MRRFSIQHRRVIDTENVLVNPAQLIDYTALAYMNCTLKTVQLYKHVYIDS